MRDTLVYRATAAAVLCDMPPPEFVLPITKNEKRVLELKEALRNFKFPKSIRIGNQPHALTYKPGQDSLPVDELSTLLDKVGIYDIELDNYVKQVAGWISHILRGRDKIYMNYEPEPCIKSTQYITFTVIEALKIKDPDAVSKIELFIPDTPTPDQLIVVVDDMSYSGKQLYSDNEHFEQVTFMLVGCTKRAHKLLTSKPKWNVKTVLPDHIPVFSLSLKESRKYIDTIIDDDDSISAGALLFVPWKIPDALSTFDMFWRGYVYIGHVINEIFYAELSLDPSPLWIPIDWSSGRTFEFDPDACVREQSIFVNSGTPFYKCNPRCATRCNQAQTNTRAEALGKLVSTIDTPLTSGKRDGESTMRFTKIKKMTRGLWNPAV